MAVRADAALEESVRRALPLRTRPWLVKIVARHDEVGMMPTQNVIHVHEDWLSTIHNIGLDVACNHMPLSVVPVGSKIVRRLGSKISVDLWRVRTLRRGFKNSLTLKDGFLARTEVRDGIAFHTDLQKAEKEALRMSRRPSVMEAREASRLRRRNAEYEEFLRSRVVARKYDSNYRVALAPYEPWLSESIISMCRHYEAEGVPLLVIEGHVVEIVPSLDEHQFANLIYQLDKDVSRAETAAVDVYLDRLFRSTDC